MEQEKGLINKLQSAITRYKFLHLKEFNFEKSEKQLIPFLKDLSSSLDVKLNIIKDYEEADIKDTIKYEPRVLNVILVSNLSLDNEKYCVSLIKKVMDCYISDYADYDGMEYNLESKIMIISDKYLSVTSKEILGSINSKYLVSMKLNHLFQDIMDDELSKDFESKVENLHKKIISILGKTDDKEEITNKLDSLICMEGRGILNGVIKLDSKLLKIPVYVKNIIEKYILIEEKKVMNLKKKRFFEEMEEDDEMLVSDISEEGIEEDIFEDEDSYEETSMDFEDEESEDEEFESDEEEDEESDEMELDDEDFEDEEEFEMSDESDEMEVSHEEITQELDSVIDSIESDIDRLKSVQDDLETHIGSDEETEKLEGEFE